MTLHLEFNGNGRVLIKEPQHGGREVRYPQGREHLSRRLGVSLPDLSADLVDIANSAFVADRLVKREGRWLRRLHLSVPVRQTEVWRRREVEESLCELLALYTEDAWSFDFKAWTAAKPAVPLQGNLPFGPHRAAVLFSGGLDSLAGLVRDLEEDKSPLAVVSHVSNSRLLHKQRTLIKSLVDRSRVRLDPVFVPLRIHRGKGNYNTNERSQRTRGFLFGCLGSAAALLVGANELRIYENGVGAINLPLTPAQLGAQSTRSTHPLAVRGLEHFLKLIFEREFRISLPCLFHTKAEMCRMLADSRWRDMAVKTVSCDGYPPRHSLGEQCGVCTSCLLRRQALWLADFCEDSITRRYRHDVLGSPGDVPVNEQRPLADMLAQVGRLQTALRSSQPWDLLCIEFPELTELSAVLESEGDRQVCRDRLSGLYRRYVREWQDFPARPSGWALTA